MFGNSEVKLLISKENLKWEKLTDNDWTAGYTVQCEYSFKFFVYVLSYLGS